MRVWVCAGLFFLLAAPMARPDALHQLKLDSMNVQAEDLALVDSAGKTRHLKEFFGKPMILHFWATWCASCAHEIPELARVSRSWSKKGVEFVAVSVDSPEKKADVAKFLDGLKPGVPLLMVQPGDSEKRYWAWGLPTTYFVDSKGRIFARALGSREWRAADVSEIFQNRKVSEKSNR